MNFATKSFDTRILVWIIWLIAVLVFFQPVEHQVYYPEGAVPLLN